MVKEIVINPDFLTTVTPTQPVIFNLEYRLSEQT